jgi:hypothetical protein
LNLSAASFRATKSTSQFWYLFTTQVVVSKVTQLGNAPSQVDGGVAIAVPLVPSIDVFQLTKVLNHFADSIVILLKIVATFDSLFVSLA